MLKKKSGKKLARRNAMMPPKVILVRQAQ